MLEHGIGVPRNLTQALLTYEELANGIEWDEAAKYPGLLANWKVQAKMLLERVF